MPVASRNKGIRSKTIPRRPKPAKKLTIAQQRMEYKRFLDVRTKDKARQEKNKARAQRSVLVGKKDVERKREQQKRQTGFARRKDVIAATNLREEAKRQTKTSETENELRKTQARGEVSRARIHDRYAKQTQIEEERLQRRVSYAEAAEARRAQRGSYKEPGAVRSGFTAPAASAGQSIAGGIFRVAAVVVGLTILLLVVSHADQSSGAISNFGNTLFGLTGNTPLFTTKQADQGATKSAN